MDLIITNALVFDGRGEAPVVADVGIDGDRIVAVGSGLDRAGVSEVVDAKRRWLMPGLWDIHTHLDLEVELDPGLTEVVRHGTTTAVVANCSIGVPFGRQNSDGHDPVVSTFARVENIPKRVLRRVAEKITWSDTQGYIDHFAHVPLGANVVPLVPYSNLRIEVMGSDAAVRRPASADELQQMEAILEEALKQGYAGFSTDALPFHYMSNDPHRKQKIPSHHASFSELKQLLKIVRNYERVWQATPPKDNPFKVFRTFLLTSGRLFGKTLKLTAVAALDLINNRMLARLVVVISHLLNSRLVKGHFHLQALGAPFKIYGDGAMTPIAEEIPALRELNEVDFEDREARLSIMNAPDYRERFRHMWYHDKRGLSIGRIKRWLKMIDDSLCRDLREMIMTAQPVSAWEEESLQQVFERLVGWQQSGQGARTEQERQAFARLPNPIGDDADFLLALFREYDTELRWYALVANDNEDTLARLLFDPFILPGFNDSGAHCTNMAYYDGNLRSLKIAQKRGEAGVAYMVQRLTRAPADFWGMLNVGSIEVGQKADLVVIDPEALRTYDSEAQMVFEHRDALGARQMLNRSDGVVTDVWVGGKRAWQDGRASALLGCQTLGRALLVSDAAGDSRAAFQEQAAE